jgi:hypothetical protein
MCIQLTIRDLMVVRIGAVILPKGQTMAYWLIDNNIVQL